MSPAHAGKAMPPASANKAIEAITATGLVRSFVVVIARTELSQLKRLCAQRLAQPLRMRRLALSPVVAGPVGR
jgi:hypothetical protein